MSLFKENFVHLKLPDAELEYYPTFYDDDKATYLFEQLMEFTPWRQDQITVFGKTYPQPRLTALYSENQKTYSYSNITMESIPMTELLYDIKRDLEMQSKSTFTAVLLNLYRNGSDSNGWHADNEKELGNNPTIASLSLGTARKFQFKHRTIENERHQLMLAHGSLLIMKPPMQSHWVHQVPKTKQIVGERINLTFRFIE